MNKTVKWTRYRGIGIAHVNQGGVMVYRVLQFGYFTTMPTLRKAKKLIDMRVDVAADVAALKAAFRNWPVDGVVKVGVADRVTA
jgi:hypothetical protein